MNYESEALKISGIKIISAFAVILYSLLLIHQSFAAEIPSDLMKSIDEKSKALQEVNQKLIEANKSLEETADTGKKLKTEIKKTDAQINQLNLSIKGSEINIDKLGLEIKSISYDIDRINNQMIIQKAGMKQFLKEIQAKDNEGLLLTLLKNRSISEGMDEFKNIADLNERLSIETQKMEKLTADLSEKLNQTSQKKSSIIQENKNLIYRKVIVAEEKQDKQKLLTQTKNQEKNYQALVTELEKEQAAIASEINQLDEELRRQIDPNLLPTQRPGVLGSPVVGGTKTQSYGITEFTRQYYTGAMKGKYHNGIDFGKFLGAEILSAEDGTVVAMGNQDSYCYRGAYGKFIVVKHNNGLTTLYAHLSGQTVKVGQEVARGQVIGYMGRTGWATGPHLHFTLYASSTFSMKQSKTCGPMPAGGDLNPAFYL